MSLSWSGAFRKAFMYVVWLIIWGVAGAALIAAGGYVGYVSLINVTSALMSGVPPVFDSALLTGLGLALLGYVVVILGSIATVIRLIYDLSRQASLEAMGTQQVPFTQRAQPQVVAAPQPRPIETRTEVPPPVQQPIQPVVAPPPIPPQMPPPQVKYCAFCGKPIATTARFCPYCQRAQP